MRVLRGRVMHDDADLARWRGQVYTATRDAWAGLPPLDGPLSCGLWFCLMIPSRRRGSSDWAATAGMMDLDKLTRAVFDAITTAKVWKDDGLVVEVKARKIYASPPDRPPGVHITIEKLPLT